MEDTFCCIQDLRLHPEISISYFAVFDGHGGDYCALFLRQNLHKQIVRAFMTPNDPGRPPLLESFNYHRTLKEALIEAFLATDLQF